MCGPRCGTLGLVPRLAPPLLASLVCCALSLAPVAPARADEARGPAALAGARFAEGERAFLAGDFVAAGRAFDEAHAQGPHHSATWNAAVAWHKAGEAARAANRYRRYLREAPADAPDRAKGTAALLELSAKLGRVDVVAPGATGVTVDGLALEDGALWVYAGTHVVEGVARGATLRATASVAAGQTITVTLLDAPSPRVEPARGPTATPPSARPAAPERPLAPWVVGLGAALTAGLVVGTVVSGVDTLDARAAYDLDPTRERFDDGRARQTRTNVLLGVTLGTAAVTLGLAVFATEWRSKPPARATARW